MRAFLYRVGFSSCTHSIELSTALDGFDSCHFYLSCRALLRTMAWHRDWNTRISAAVSKCQYSWSLLGSTLVSSFSLTS